jgi:hypothetical protein
MIGARLTLVFKYDKNIKQFNKPIDQRNQFSLNYFEIWNFINYSSISNCVLFDRLIKSDK